MTLVNSFSSGQSGSLTSFLSKDALSFGTPQPDKQKAPMRDRLKIANNFFIQNTSSALIIYCFYKSE